MYVYTDSFMHQIFYGLLATTRNTGRKKTEQTEGFYTVDAHVSWPSNIES